jgi:hypothetical protein
MNAIHSRKKLVTAALSAAVAVTAVPGLLFVGAGSASAGTLNVWWDHTPVGITAHVADTLGVTSNCSYNSWAASTPLPVAPRGFFSSFTLPAHGVWWAVIPGVPTGTVWNVDVQCDDGQQTMTTHVY